MVWEGDEDAPQAMEGASVRTHEPAPCANTEANAERHALANCYAADGVRGREHEGRGEGGETDVTHAHARGSMEEDLEQAGNGDGHAASEAGRNGREGMEVRRRERDDAEAVECVVYAWWAGYGDGSGRTLAAGRSEHVYVSRLRPTSPLEVGMRVAVVAMANRRKAEEGRPLEFYEPYDPHVVGIIDGIQGLTETWVRARIRNLCRGNTVGTVNLDIPHLPGVTVRRPWMAGGRPDAVWIGSTPAGEPGRVAATSETGWCGASRCGLEQMTGRAGWCFRARPGRGGEKIERDEREGEFRLHLWLRYEGY